MNRIQTQAQKLWQTISAPETGSTYQQAWAVTVQILKETGLLLWLVVCLFLVAFDWFWKFSIKAGSDFREWFNSMEAPSPERIVSESGKTLVTVGKESFSKALNQARTQLGFSQPAAATATSTAKPAAKSAVQSPTVPTTPPAPKPESTPVNSSADVEPPVI